MSDIGPAIQTRSLDNTSSPNFSAAAILSMNTTGTDWFVRHELQWNHTVRHLGHCQEDLWVKGLLSRRLEGLTREWHDRTVGPSVVTYFFG